MKLDKMKQCPLCHDSGIASYPTEYPNLEDRRCCPGCKVGQAFAARLAEIVAHARTERRVRVA